jgi:DNA-binding NarL/FixJ family response regulator
MTSARILIVEDERIITQALRRRLTALGHTVVGLAASGDDVVAQADTLWPDVLLLDIGLRGAMSSRTTSGRNASATASTPSWAVRRSWPMRRSSRAKLAAEIRLSSTTSIR